jgi:cell division protein FtsB
MPRRRRNSFEVPHIKLPDLGKLARFDLSGLRGVAKQLVVLAGVLVVILVMLNLNSRLGEYSRLSTERDSLSTRVAGLASTRAVLETQVAYSQSDEAAEDYARSAHMIHEGEQLVVPMAPAGAVTPTPEVTQEAPPEPLNWEVWWALFFAP